MEAYDRSSVRLQLKVRALKTDVQKSSRCYTGASIPSKVHDYKPRHIHHSVILLCLGWP